ncbi:MBL fold metallo-hydrolase [Halosimplex litoreum]|uniref:MBL fold metallo-hydrolase n=1 Tax=Halosimplex litoreum TaxID=1198301 RepID=A0A7T3FXI9_9EURY|nr:MBL fold metallo-hydrolase [Halosimplex litoreum]QPV62555.1 MBL fold metallo-hydrolase [Halosimplex litoreum]
MRVTFLGTGSAMPTGERFQTGILLESGGGNLLVDCGSGVLHGLQRTDVGYEGIDAVLLTHHHLDHVSDLLPLLKARWLAGATELTIAGPEGTEGLISDLLGVHDYMQGRVDLDFREVGPESFSLAGFDVTGFEVRHSMDCLAYRFEESGASPSDADDDDGDRPAFVFSGDTEAFPELVAFADGAAVLAHDCSFPDSVDVDNHPTPSELGTALAEADAEVGRVYLTHLYPHTDGRHDEMLDSIDQRYDGDVRFASDGLSLDID